MGRGYGDRVVGLVLAGGLAERMGRCKALLPITGKSALELIANRMGNSRIEKIIVVTGGHEALVHPEALRLGCLPVHNPAYRSGMFSSVLAGVRALPSETEAFFLLPVDTPMVRAATYRSLISAFYENGRPDIVYPTFKEVGGASSVDRAQARRENRMLAGSRRIEGVPQGMFESRVVRCHGGQRDPIRYGYSG